MKIIASSSPIWHNKGETIDIHKGDKVEHYRVTGSSNSYYDSLLGVIGQSTPITVIDTRRDEDAVKQETEQG